MKQLRNFIRETINEILHDESLEETLSENKFKRAWDKIDSKTSVAYYSELLKLAGGYPDDIELPNGEAIWEINDNAWRETYFDGHEASEVYRKGHTYIIVGDREYKAPTRAQIRNRNMEDRY